MGLDEGRALLAKKRGSPSTICKRLILELSKIYLDWR